MIEMARIAGGRHYHCDDPKDVPGVMVRETRAATADDTRSASRPPCSARCRACRPTAPRHWPVTCRDESQARGRAVADGRRPRSIAGLVAFGRGDRRRLDLRPARAGQPGLAEVAGYPEFWQRLVRHAASRPAPPEWQLSVSRQGDCRRVGLETVSHPPTTELPEAIRLTAGDACRGKSRSDPASGCQRPLRSRFPPWIGRVSDRRADRPFGRPAAILGTLRCGSTIPTNCALGPDNVALLQAIAASTGGRFNPPVEALLAPDGRTVPAATPPGAR
jgi:hypothetical protein